MRPIVTASTFAPSRHVIGKGIQGFIFFSVIGTLLSFWWKRPGRLDEILPRLDWGFILLLIPLIAMDYVLGGLRYRLFLNGKIFPKISLWDCVRANWVNMFMGAVTPFASGGAPAQFFFFWRRGAAVTDALLISSVNFGATLLFLLFSSVVAFWWIPSGFFGEGFTAAFQAGFLIIGGIACIMLSLLFFPRIGYFVIHRLFSLIPLRRERHLNGRVKLLLRIEGEIERFGSGFRRILQHSKGTLLLTTIATFILFSNKYVMGYVVARGMGQPVPFDLFFGLQIVQYLLVYFAPTPGASGVAELSATWLMGKMMPESILLIYVVVWRFSITIFAAIFGGFILFREIHQHGRSDKFE